MSLTDHEDTFVAELHRLADAEQPPLDLDAAATVRGGRVRRRRRAMRNGALGVLATAAIAVGVTQLVSLEPAPTEPALPTQAPPVPDDGAPSPHTLDGVALPFAAVSIDSVTTISPEELFRSITELPDTTPEGAPIFAMAMTEDGRVVVSISSEDNFDGDQFLAPERLGLWSPAGFELFDDVSGVPEGDTFRYSYFASAADDAVTWVETSSTQGTGLWRIFAHVPDGGTSLVAKAEDGHALGYEFGGDAMPRVLGDRAVWASEGWYSGVSEGLVLLSAPLDGSGTLRVESDTVTQPAVGDRGAFFLRENGTLVSVLREDGTIEDVFRYPFTTAPSVSLAAAGDMLMVGVHVDDDAGTSTWIDVIDLTAQSVTRIEGASGLGDGNHVCGRHVVWHEYRPDDDGGGYWSAMVFDPATGELHLFDTVTNLSISGCADERVVWRRLDGTRDEELLTEALATFR